MAFPSVVSFLNRTIDKRDEPSTVYVATLKNHPGFLKLGFCQVSTRGLRVSDPEIGRIIWESCIDQELTDVAGDIPREQCWLFEQYCLEYQQQCREQIPALAKKRWPGYTETLRISEENQAGFREWISEEACKVFSTHYDGLEEMLDQLVRTEEERKLYKERQRLWTKDPNYDGSYSEKFDPYV